jgi:hypothetical protein
MQTLDSSSSLAPVDHNHNTQLKSKSKKKSKNVTNVTNVTEPVIETAEEPKVIKTSKPRVKKSKEILPALALPPPPPPPLQAVVEPEPEPEPEPAPEHQVEAEPAIVPPAASKAKTKPTKPKPVVKVKEPKVKGVKKSKQATVSEPSACAASVSSAVVAVASSLKKRGRKPKGGKIIVATAETDIDSAAGPAELTSTVLAHSSVVSSNVILHLKCGYEDMHASSISVFKYEPTVETIESYTDVNDISETACEFTHVSKSSDEESNKKPSGGLLVSSSSASASSSSSSSATASASSLLLPHPIHTHINVTVNAASNSASSATTGLSLNLSSHHSNSAYDPRDAATSHSNNLTSLNNNSTTPSESLKDIWKKVNKLKVVLHHDNAMFNAVQHSACFWDTCEFDTPVIHIPKLYNKMADSYTVYGCFCSPECAASYLIRESLDASVKFERLQMLNAMYNNICNNTDKPIKPAPDPRYMLNKYYGNLTIEEYRKLLKSDHLLYIVNKPLTHSLPELYDDNNEFLVNGKPATASGSCSSAAATSINGLGMGMGMGMGMVGGMGTVMGAGGAGSATLKNKYAFSKSTLVK